VFATPRLCRFKIPDYREFATSRLRRFEIPDYRESATLGLHRFEIPNYREFATSGLRRFGIPENRKCFAPEKHISRTSLNSTFRGRASFLNSPSNISHQVIWRNDAVILGKRERQLLPTAAAMRAPDARGGNRGDW
jgi:hypothetical protein